MLFQIVLRFLNEIVCFVCAGGVLVFGKRFELFKLLQLKINYNDPCKFYFVCCVPPKTTFKFAFRPHCAMISLLKVKAYCLEMRNIAQYILLSLCLVVFLLKKKPNVNLISSCIVWLDNARIFA